MTTGWGVITRDHRYVTADETTIRDFVCMDPNRFVGADYLDAGIVAEEQHHRWWKRLDVARYTASVEPFRDVAGNPRITTVHFSLLPRRSDMALFVACIADEVTSHRDGMREVQIEHAVHDSVRFARLIRQSVAELLLAQGLPVPRLRVPGRS